MKDIYVQIQYFCPLELKEKLEISSKIKLHGYVLHQQMEYCYQEGMDLAKLLKVILLQLILENHDGN